MKKLILIVLAFILVLARLAGANSRATSKNGRMPTSLIIVSS